MLGVAVGWQIYAKTHRAIDLGYVGLVQLVPAVVLSLFAGSVADRFDRARIVAACNAALALGAGALAMTGGRIGAVYIVLFFVGAARAFEAPASQSLVATLVPKEDLPSALAWSSMLWQGATIVGPSIGGALYAVRARAGDVYVPCAVLFVLAAMFALGTREKEQARATEGVEESVHVVRSVLEGLRFVRKRPVILESISLDLFAVLFGGATALLPIFASDVLRIGPIGLGALRSGPAVGAALTGIVLARFPLRAHAGPIMLACVALFGAATIAFGMSRSFALSLAMLIVIGASDMVSVVVRGTVVQLATPDAMRGRVSSVSMLFVAMSSELGELESGVTAAWLGAPLSVIAGGIGTLAIVALYTFGFRALRSTSSLEGTSP